MEEWAEYCKQIAAQAQLSFVRNNSIITIENESFEFVIRGIKVSDIAFSVHEDLWITRQDILKSKIKSILGLNDVVYARDCTVRRIESSEAKLFLAFHHLHGATKSKLRFGLFEDGALLAVATFAGTRMFGESKSAELIRYCQYSGITIVGGLDKLLSAYIDDVKPNDIMTYVDLEWGSGDAFLKLGFEKIQKRDPITFCIDEQTYIRSIYNEAICNGYALSNKGSLKLVRQVEL